jgi:hypothetical protein
MPPDTLVYAELKNPGDQLTTLLEQLGLLAGTGPPAGQEGQRVAISPALVKELLGIGGAAVAVTGFDPFKQMPAGVLIFHPGDVEVIRGAIETGLPIGGTPVKPIRGYPTYDIEGQATVTLTSRLVVVSTQRPQIINVLRRLDGEETRSFADNEALADALQSRDDSLVFFCVNAKPIMPLLSGMMGVASSESQELAIAQALLDLNSLRSLVGHVGISDEGLFFETALRLDEGHRNLVYNFLRTARINPETVKCIPDGAAGFVVTALNESSSRYMPGAVAEGMEPPVVTAMDIGREIFANITGLAIYAVPPTGAPVPSGLPIPDVAAVFTVNDPARSKALWSLMLGVGSLAAGVTSSIEGAPVEIEGVSAYGYQFPEGVTVYFAAVDHNVWISPSKTAIAQSIAALHSGRSVLNDEVFGESVSGLSENTTLGVFVHPARCAQIVKQFVPPYEVAEIEPLLAAMADTVASMTIEHSDEILRVSGMVTGLPEVGPIVSEMYERERQRHDMHVRLSKARHSGDWGEALETIDALLGKQPGNVDLLCSRFDALATGKRDRAAALACGETILEGLNDSASALNSFAWALLTKERYQGAYAELARRMSLRSNELTSYKNWAFVDTLALAEFEIGNVERAVELERKCLDLCGKASGRAGVEKALARFEAALDKD